MKRTGVLGGLLILAAVAGVATLGPAQTPATGLVVRNGTLIDGTGAPPRPGTSVLVRGGTIVKVGPASEVDAPGATVVDATGKFILPGLIDSHVHYLEWETPYYPYFGVTTIFDLGNLSEWIVAQREAQRNGQIPGARLYTTGNHLNGPAKPGDEIRSADRAGWIHIVSDRKSTLDALAALMSYPVDALKIQERLDGESLRTIVEFAGQRSLPIVGHTTNARDAANLGVRFIEHMTPIVRATSPNGSTREADMDPARFDGLIDLLISKRVVVNPTLALLHVQASRHNAAFKQEDAELYPTFTGVPQSVRDIWMHEFYEDDALRAVKQEGFPKVSVFLKRFADRGGRILSGTDAGRRVMPGHSLHREMQMLVEIGLTPMEAIKATTIYPAEFFGLDGLTGTVAEGKRADLLVVDADPLADITNTRRIAHVVLDGRLLDRGPESLAYRNPMPRPVSDEPIPVIESVTPLRFVQGQADGVITVRGKNFIPESVVDVGGTRAQHTRNPDGSLRVSVPASVTRAVGTYQVAVVNPLPGGGHSNSRYIFVDYAPVWPEQGDEHDHGHQN